MMDELCGIGNWVSFFVCILVFVCCFFLLFNVYLPLKHTAVVRFFCGAISREIREVFKMRGGFLRETMHGKESALAQFDEIFVISVLDFSMG